MNNMCPDCGLVNEPIAKYCVGCGAVLQCTGCGLQRTPLAKFCTECGSSFESNSQQTEAINRADCLQCEHYRPPLHISTRIQPLLPSAEASEALSAIQKEERTLEAQEFSEMRDRVQREITEWSQRPVMSAHCAQHEDQKRYEIIESKNSDGKCKDFRVTSEIRQYCADCIRRSTVSVAPAGHTGPDWKVELNEAKRKDWNVRYASEILSAWYARGYLPHTPKFHDYCGALSTGGRYALCLYANPYNKCHLHEAR